MATCNCCLFCCFLTVFCGVMFCFYFFFFFLNHTSFTWKLNWTIHLFFRPDNWVLLTCTQAPRELNGPLLDFYQFVSIFFKSSLQLCLLFQIGFPSAEWKGIFICRNLPTVFSYWSLPHHEPVLLCGCITDSCHAGLVAYPDPFLQWSYQPHWSVAHTIAWYKVCASQV